MNFKITIGLSLILLACCGADVTFAQDLYQKGQLKLETYADSDSDRSQSERIELQYQWDKYSKLQYDVLLKVALDQDETYLFSGKIEYYNIVPKPDLEVINVGNGTGFNISPDGYLLTCAHVIEGSDEVTVVYPDATYQGQVVAIDGKSDLAVVKIEPKEPLPILPLALSDDVETDNSISCYGFPYAGNLGKRLKFVAGKVERKRVVDEVPFVLFKGNVNPGNSGGPVLDEQGSVIGVTAQRIKFGPIRKGLAVANSRTKEFLRKNRIPFYTNDDPKWVPVTNLAKYCQSTVPLILINQGKGRSKNYKQFYTEFQVELKPVFAREASKKLKNDELMGLSQKLKQSLWGRLLVDSNGTAIEKSVNIRLPWLKNTMVELPLVEFPQSGLPKRWENSYYDSLAFGSYEVEGDDRSKYIDRFERYSLKQKLDFQFKLSPFEAKENAFILENSATSVAESGDEFLLTTKVKQNSIYGFKLKSALEVKSVWNKELGLVQSLRGRKTTNVTFSGGSKEKKAIVDFSAKLSNSKPADVKK